MCTVAVLQWPTVLEKYYPTEWLHFKNIKLDSVFALSLAR